MTLEQRLKKIEGLDGAAMEAARRRWNQVAKPLHSLGALEDDIVKIAGIVKSAQIDLSKKTLVILCADNGIVEENVTQTGQEVTAVVTENFTKGESCACIMAACAGMDVWPVNIGVVREPLKEGKEYPLVHRKIASGTRNFLKGPAMTREETVRAIETGIRLVQDLKEKGCSLIATGEMGIGNTTTSSAVAAVLLGETPKRMTGRGAGLTDEGLMRKIHVITKGIELHRPDPMDGIDVLSKVGGFDLAGLTGVFLGGALYRIPVLIDGFISGTAALTAVRMAPESVNYMLASHVSAEPAGKLVLDALGLEPLIRAGMCLGEGTGAVAAVPLLTMAEAVYNQMSTFHEIEIDDYKPLS